MYNYVINLFVGKIFLNSIEHLDPVTDEWTTFVTVPEKSIIRAKNMPLNVDLAESTIELKGKDTEKIGTPEARTNEGTNDKNMEESPLFEMDMDPNACNQSVSDTMHEKHNAITSGDGTITEQDRRKDPITFDDTTDAVSKHVLR